MPHIRLLSMPCLYSIWSPYSNRKRVVPPSKGHFHRSYDFITSDFMAFPRVLNVGTAAAMRSSADIFGNCVAFCELALKRLSSDIGIGGMTRWLTMY